MIKDSENSWREIEEEKGGCNRGNKKEGLIIQIPCKWLTGIIA